jgi:hypothetical protein
MNQTETRTVFVVIVILLVAALPVSAQKSNTLTFGPGGGGLLGVTYERQLLQAGRVSLDAHLSAGYLIFGGLVPHGLTAAIGGEHALQIGVLGTAFAMKPLSLGILGPADDDWVFGYRVRPLIGYRRRASEGGLVIRAYFSPYIYNDENLVANDNASGWSILPWGGLMFGFAF